MSINVFESLVWYVYTVIAGIQSKKINAMSLFNGKGS